MNTDRTARTGTEAEDGVTHYAGGTANAFARALAYEVGRGAEVYAAPYGVTAVEWKVPGFRLAIEVDASGWFHVMQALDECREDYENMSLTRAAEVARGWLDLRRSGLTNAPREEEAAGSVPQTPMAIRLVLPDGPAEALGRALHAATAAALAGVP